MTKKQKAAEDARNAAKMFESVEVDYIGTQEVYQLFPASDSYPDGRKEFVAQISKNFAGSGPTLCIYIPEPDPVIAWQGNGITLGGFADSPEDAMNKIRTIYTN